MEGALCARVVAAHDNWAAIAPQSAIRNRLEANSFKNLTGRAVPLYQQKSPTRHLGASSNAPSREERGSLRHGRVAWLTAFQPITVAGPRPIHTAFPASFAYKLNFECMPRRMECQCTTENGTTENGVTEEMPPVFSGSSSWACAFPQVRAALPANPQGDKAHSRKCSSTA